MNRCPALPSSLAWFGGSQEEPAITSARVKSTSRGEGSTENNLVHSGADEALASKKSPENGTTSSWNDPEGWHAPLGTFPAAGGGVSLADPLAERPAASTGP